MATDHARACGCGQRCSRHKRERAEGAQDRREREGQRGLRPRAPVNGGHSVVAEETPKWALPRGENGGEGVSTGRGRRGGAVRKVNRGMAVR
jgi:hypothetical protein